MNGGYPPAGIEQGFDGAMLPASTPEVWTVGSVQKVAWAISANHGGGYSYRLCKIEPGKNVSEACFQQTPLEFVNDTSWIVWPEAPATSVTEPEITGGGKTCHAVEPSQCGDQPGVNTCLKCGTGANYTCEKCCPGLTKKVFKDYTYCSGGKKPKPSPSPPAPPAPPLAFSNPIINTGTVRYCAAAAVSSPFHPATSL